MVSFPVQEIVCHIQDIDTSYPSALNGHVFLDVPYYQHCVDIDHKDILLFYEQTEYKPIVVLLS